MNIIIPKISEKTVELPGRSDVIKGVVTVLLSMASLGGASPLGLAFAATFSSNTVYIPMLALLVGAVVSGLKLRYLTGFFVYRLLIYLRKREDKGVKAVALGFSLLFTGAVELLLLGGGAKDALYLAIESVVVALFYLLFLHVDEKNGWASASVLVIVSAVFNGLSGMDLPRTGVNVGGLCAMFTSACMCYALNLPTAVLGGCIMGFLVNIDGGNAVVSAGIYGTASLLGAMMSSLGKWGVCAGFLSGITVCVLERGEFSGIGLADVIVAMAAFVILPEVVHYKIFGLMEKLVNNESSDDRYSKRISAQLRNIAGAVQNLADGITGIQDRGRDRNVLVPVFDSVAARVCRGCAMEGNCWRKESEKTYENMYELWGVIEADGYCDHTNIPLGFRQVCLRSEGFLTEFNHAYELFKQNKLYQGEAVAERDIVARQYGEISRFIKVLSRQVESGDSEDEELSVRYKVTVTFCQEPKRGQAVCGDSLIHFERNGKYYVILCDGMGSGEGALSQSRLTARMFSEFLRAGFCKEVAVNLINSTLALNVDKESFSTVDLLEIDLQTGVAEFLKIGSAQSFLKVNRVIEEISSKALPVGILENIQVETQTRMLKNKDVVLMVSDGIGEAGEGVMKTEWIKKMMMLEDRTDEDVLKLILAGAKIRSRIPDDMTGIIIRLKKIRSDQL